MHLPQADRSGSTPTVDQLRARLVAKLAGAASIGCVRLGLVDEDVMLERRGEDGGEIVARLADRALERVDVIVDAGNPPGAFSRRRARRGGTPGRHAVIGALGDD